ncbi:FAS1 domain-containing protein, partial [Trichophaea hybrida]
SPPAGTDSSDATNSLAVTDSPTATESPGDTDFPTASDANSPSAPEDSNTADSPNSTGEAQPPTTSSTKGDTINPPAAVFTTTFSPVTATISGSEVIVTPTDEVVPLRLASSQRPAPPDFIADIMAALSSQPDLTIFTSMVSQAPEVLRSLNSTKKYYFFTPRDEDIASILARRQEDEDKYIPVSTTIHFAEMPEGERDLKIKEYTLVTALKGEVEYIALGDGEGARIVSQPPEETDGKIRIISGLGRVRNVKGEAIKFERGEIHKTDGFFTHPVGIEQTFENTGGKKFLSALETTGLLDTVNNTRKITIFAPQDSAFDGRGAPDEGELNRYIHGGLAFTPELGSRSESCYDSEGSTTLVVTLKGKDKFINGAKILKSNIIAKNGVIHYIEKVS